jgi:CHASE3 domain sensor protein
VGLAALTTVTLATVTLALVVLTIIGPRVDRSNDMLSALQDGHIAMINQETGLRGFLVTREERFLEPYWKGAADLDRADAELAALARAEPDLEEHILALEAAEQDYIQQWAAPTLAAQRVLGS